MNATTKILAMPDADTAPRKPRIMIAGEFSAGKSRLINALLGKDVLPSNVTSTALPPIWLVYGDQPPLVVGIDGEVMDLDMGEIDVETTAFCVVSSRSPILEYVDLIDTPGNSDPKIPAICWERMVQYADSLVWCTSAMQAWKQTEKATCADLPEDLLENATLLITQADRMPDERSANKVERRVTRDASKYFSTIMMGSMLDEFDAKCVRDRLISISAELPLRGAEEELVDQVREDTPADADTTTSEAEAWAEDWQEDTAAAPVEVGPWAEGDEEAGAPEASGEEDEPTLVTPVVDDFTDETESEALEAMEAVASQEDADEAFEAGGSFTPLEDTADDETAPEEVTAPETEETEAASADAEDATTAEAEAGDAPETAEDDAPEDGHEDAIAASVMAAMEGGADTPAEPEVPMSFGQPNGTFAGMWRRITADTELTDNERFMTCVGTLLEEVRELIRANEDANGRRDK